MIYAIILWASTGFGVIFGFLTCSMLSAGRIAALEAELAEREEAFRALCVAAFPPGKVMDSSEKAEAQGRGKPIR